MSGAGQPDASRAERGFAERKPGWRADASELTLASLMVAEAFGEARLKKYGAQLYSDANYRTLHNDATERG